MILNIYKKKLKILVMQRIKSCAVHIYYIWIKIYPNIYQKRVFKLSKCKATTFFNSSFCSCDLNIVLCDDKSQCKKDNCSDTHILCMCPDKR